MVVCGVAILVAAPPARSDAPCAKGYRDSTPAERATMTAVLQAAKKALPPAPTGWVIVGDDQISVTTNLCRDYEDAPWSYDFNREYQRVDDQAARDKIIADAGAASNAAYELKKPRLDAIMAKMQKLTERQVALLQKNDFAGAEAMNGEKAKLEAEYKKVLDEGDSDEQFAAAAARASHDMTMNIDVAVNSNQVMPDASATSLALPPGARAAFQWNTTREQITEGHALILLGQWQRNADGSWRRVRHPEMAPTAAQVISISINADPERLAATIASIDIKGLATKVPN
jgi:hypothetical protein